jgi:hypothetical protein
MILAATLSGRSKMIQSFSCKHVLVQSFSCTHVLVVKRIAPRYFRDTVQNDLW